MQVRETTLKELIQGEKQFRVPLWQRQYSWERDEHLLLWSDIMEQYAQLLPSSAAVRVRALPWEFRPVAGIVCG